MKLLFITINARYRRITFTVSFMSFLIMRDSEGGCHISYIFISFLHFLNFKLSQPKKKQKKTKNNKRNMIFPFQLSSSYLCWQLFRHYTGCFWLKKILWVLSQSKPFTCYYFLYRFSSFKKKSFLISFGCFPRTSCIPSPSIPIFCLVFVILDNLMITSRFFWKSKICVLF